MKELLPSSIRQLAAPVLVASLFLVGTSGAFAQTWTGAADDKKWSNAANWNPGVPGLSGNVFINSSSHPSVDLDVDTTIGSLTLTQYAVLYDDDRLGSSARNLFVQGATTINRTSSYPTGFDATSGANFRLGTLSNFSNGVLSDCMLSVFDNDGTASNLATRIQFHGANVITNNAFIFLEGADAAIVDQDTGLNAFRNLAANTNQFYVGSSVIMTWPGNFANTGDIYIYDELATPTAKLTVNGTFTNSGANGYVYMSSGGDMLVTGDFNNNGSGFNGGIILQARADAPDPITPAKITVQGTLRNAFESFILVEGRTAPARLIVNGNLTNSGFISLKGLGSLEVAGVISMNGGEVSLQASPGFETFKMTAQRIDLAAGTRFGARGTLFADLVDSGIFAPGASPGLVTIQGAFTMTNTARLDIEIGGLTPGTQHDQVVQHPKQGGGGVTLNGTLALSFANGFEAVIQPTDTFTILTSDLQVTGAFSNVASGGRVSMADGGGSFRVDYPQESNTVSVTQFQVAPPPTITSIPVSAAVYSQISIFGVGLLGTTAAQVNGISGYSVSVVSDTEVIFNITGGSTSGPVTLITNHGTAVSSTNLTVLADSDYDGMSDDFEQLYFGSPTGGDPNADSDGDGVINRNEFIAGTSPIDSTSKLRITQIRRVGNDVVIRFPQAADKRYRLQATSALESGWSLNLVTLPAGAANLAQEVSDTNAFLQPKRFYRVVAIP